MRLSLSYPAAIVAAALSLAVLRAAPAAGPVEFVAHDIDPKMPGPYAVNTADFNKDGKWAALVAAIWSAPRIRRQRLLLGRAVR